MSKSKTSPRLTVSTVFELLANPIRRQILYYLRKTQTDSVGREELAMHLFREMEELTSPRRARTVLLQIHLPKLADCGAVEIDQQNDRIRYRNEPRLEAAIDFAADHEPTPL